MSIIARGSAWRYVIPAKGIDAKHFVIMIDEGTIFTWSDPIANPDCGGYSFMGDETLFRESFEPWETEPA